MLNDNSIFNLHVNHIALSGGEAYIQKITTTDNIMGIKGLAKLLSDEAPDVSFSKSLCFRANIVYDVGSFNVSCD